jgi:hypothetical protein
MSAANSHQKFDQSMPSTWFSLLMHWEESAQMTATERIRFFSGKVT